MRDVPPHQIRVRLDGEPYDSVIAHMVRMHIEVCDACTEWMRLHESDDYHHWVYPPQS